MGKVTVPAIIENLIDLENAIQGVIPSERIRRVQVEAALVDTGATGLLMPKSMIRQLGLRQFRTRRARTVGGEVELPVYAAARLTVQGRDCPMDVFEVDDSLPVIIGQIPLEAMDWVVDPKNQRLVGNPEHGGEHITEAY